MKIAILFILMPFFVNGMDKEAWEVLEAAKKYDAQDPKSICVNYLTPKSLYQSIEAKALFKSLAELRDKKDSRLSLLPRELMDELTHFCYGSYLHINFRNTENYKSNCVEKYSIDPETRLFIFRSLPRYISCKEIDQSRRMSYYAQFIEPLSFVMCKKDKQNKDYVVDLRHVLYFTQKYGSNWLPIFDSWLKWENTKCACIIAPRKKTFSEHYPIDDLVRIFFRKYLISSCLTTTGDWADQSSDTNRITGYEIG